MDKAEKDRRLGEALRANLRRRKVQAKSRRAGDEDVRAGLPAAPEPSRVPGDDTVDAQLQPDSDRKTNH